MKQPLGHAPIGRLGSGVDLLQQHQEKDIIGKHKRRPSYAKSAIQWPREARGHEIPEEFVMGSLESGRLVRDRGTEVETAKAGRIVLSG